MPDAAEVAPLLERLILVCAGGCTCLTKSPEAHWHDPLCHYRLFTEAAAEIAILQADR